MRESNFFLTAASVRAEMLKGVLGVVVGLVLGHVILGINALMLIPLLLLKICLPDLLYWKSIKYFFTQVGSPLIIIP